MRRVLPHKQTRARRVEWATLALAASRNLSSDGEPEGSIIVKTAVGLIEHIFLNKS